MYRATTDGRLEAVACPAGRDGSVERLGCSVETDAGRRQRSRVAVDACGARSCKQQGQGGDGGQAQDGVAGLVDALDVGLVARVPHHVSDTVPRVEGEGDAGDGLEGHLGGDREARKEGHQRCRVDQPDRVGAGHHQEAGRQADPGDSVERRQHGRQLLFVDLQVRRNRSVLSLGHEDRLLLHRRGSDRDDVSHVQARSDDPASGGAGHGGPCESGEVCCAEHACCVLVGGFVPSLPSVPPLLPSQWQQAQQKQAHIPPSPLHCPHCWERQAATARPITRYGFLRTGPGPGLGCRRVLSEREGEDGVGDGRKGGTECCSEVHLCYVLFIEP